MLSLGLADSAPTIHMYLCPHRKDQYNANALLPSADQLRHEQGTREATQGCWAHIATQYPFRSILALGAGTVRFQRMAFVGVVGSEIPLALYSCVFCFGSLPFPRVSIPLQYHAEQAAHRMHNETITLDLDEHPLPIVPEADHSIPRRTFSLTYADYGGLLSWSTTATKVGYLPPFTLRLHRGILAELGLEVWHDHGVSQRLKTPHGLRNSRPRIHSKLLEACSL